MSDVSQDALYARMAIVDATSIMTAPHVLMRPRVFADGTAWIALYGENLAIGVSGIGDTPSEACAQFDIAWSRGRTPDATRALKLEGASDHG